MFSLWWCWFILLIWTNDDEWLLLWVSFEAELDSTLWCFDSHFKRWGIKAFREGLIFKGRKRLSREVVEEDKAEKKRRKAYFRDVENRDSENNLNLTCLDVSPPWFSWCFFVLLALTCYIIEPIQSPYLRWFGSWRAIRRHGVQGHESVASHQVKPQSAESRSRYWRAIDSKHAPCHSEKYFHK